MLSVRAALLGAAQPGQRGAGLLSCSCGRTPVGFWARLVTAAWVGPSVQVASSTGPGQGGPVTTEFRTPVLGSPSPGPCRILADAGVRSPSLRMALWRGALSAQHPA